MLRSANGYSANDRTLIASYTIPGTKQRISLRKGDTSVILLDLLGWLHRNVEPLDLGIFDDWGYAERAIRGSATTLSNHASGTAVDANATQHPMGVRGTWSAEEKRKITARLGFYEGCVRWGENYSSRIDGMHFEINAGAAACKRVADKIRAAAAKPKPVPTGARPTIRRGAAGPAVELLHRFLGVVAPGAPGYGTFGPATETAVRRYQQMRGLTADGVVGEATWREMGL